MNAAKLRVAQMHHVVCAFYGLATIAAKLFKHSLIFFALARARLCLGHVQQLVYNTVVCISHFAEGLEPLPCAGADCDCNQLIVVHFLASFSSF